MNSNTQYFVEILEKIGTPLMRSVIALGTAEGADIDQAQALAELLSRTVQASINMGSGFNFAEMSDQGDSVRVALAALAGPLVAAQYEQNKVMPSEADLTKIVAVLDSVLTFAENFKPSAENAQRLADLKASGKEVDAPQAELQYMQAFLPVVQVVSGFSFGQPSNKLALDIADRLVKRSVEFRELQFSTITDGDAQKRCELVIVRAMAQLYADCYRAVMQKMALVAESGADVPTIDTVWAEFDIRASMLEVMMQGVMPDSGARTKGGADVAPVVSDSVEAVTQAVPSVDVPVEADALATPPIFGVPSPIEPDAVIEPAEETPAIFGAVPPAEEEPAPEMPPADAVIEPEVPQEAASVSVDAANPMAMFAAPTQSDDEVAAVSDDGESSVPVAPVEAVVKDKDEEEKAGDNANPMSFFTGGE